CAPTTRVPNCPAVCTDHPCPKLSLLCAQTTWVMHCPTTRLDYPYLNRPMACPEYSYLWCP
ncbi:unnamed protein product, partial [Staurois parvus]